MYSLYDVKWKTLKSTGCLGVMTNPHIYNTIIIRTKKPIILYVNKKVLSAVIFLDRLVNVPITPWHMRGRHTTLFSNSQEDTDLCYFQPISSFVQFLRMDGWDSSVVNMFQNVYYWIGGTYHLRS